MKIKNLFVLYLAAVIAATSCSKDDSPEKEPINEIGGEIYRSQVVTIDLGSTVIPEDEYTATFAGTATTVMKNPDGRLQFFVPSSTPLGAQSIIIPALNNATVNYEVKEISLPEGPDAAVEPMFSNFEVFAESLDDSPEAQQILGTIASLNAIYENASEEDKIKIASLYKANKALFDNIILEDFSSITGTGRLSANDILCLAKHSHAVWVMAGGAIVVLIAPDPLDKLFGAGISALGAYKAYTFFQELQDDNLITSNILMDDIYGTNNRGGSPVLMLNSNEEKTVSFNSVDRKLTVNDAGRTGERIVSFFEDFNKYNSISAQLNSVIQWGNDNIPFCNISLITIESLPQSSPAVEAGIDAATFSSLDLAINHPSLALEKAELSSSGEIILKVKIIGTPEVLPVEANLQYSYDDGFSSFSGTLPIKVSDTSPLVGTWVMESFLDGIPAGEYHYLTVDECPELPYAKETFNSIVYVFNADNTWTISQEWHMVDFNIMMNIENCTVISDGEDTTDTDNSSNYGTYTYNGDTITFIPLGSGSGSYTPTITFINENRIKISTEIYNRQN